VSFNRQNPCPICRGYDEAPRGVGVRCYGRLSEDGEWAFCTREEHAGSLPLHESSQTYAHRLAGSCACGVPHAVAAPGAARAARRRPPRIPCATYDYRDADGALLFQVVRFEPKGFAQRRPRRATDDSSALRAHGIRVEADWVWSLYGLEPADGTTCPKCNGSHRQVPAVRRVLYRLPELLTADPAAPVFIVEGEKDAEALAALGLVATTNPGGAKKWSPEYSEMLRGRQVVVLPDNDKDGRLHSAQVAATHTGIATSVRVVSLPGLREHGDVSDWIAAGGTRKQLEALVATTPEWDATDGNAGGGGAPDAEAGGEHRADGGVGDDPHGANGTGKPKLPTQATRLVNLAAQAELFHTADQQTFATIVVDGHAETWSLRSSGFRLWLLRRFHLATGKIPSSQALQDAIQTLRGQALFDGKEHPVFTRLGEHEGAIYLDRADPEWMVIRIGPMGWELVKNPPMKFRRSRGMLPLPEPVREGTITDLARFLNVWDESTWRVVVAWMLATFRPHGPYPILLLNGEQGSAKSTLSRVLRKLIDPSKVPLRRPPRDERDLMIAASNSWVIALDNLSHLPAWLSDALSSLSTGGGLGTRELYSDEDEVLFDATRPIIVNGIEEIATHSDFLDRSLAVTLPEIAPERRRAEKEFWSAFEASRPAILGAFLNGVVAALRTLPDVHLDERPRMADFAEWVTAAEAGLGWASGAFMTAYAGNREDTNILALDANPVSAPLRTLVAEGDFEGTATTLLKALHDRVDDAVTRQPGWPKGARGLSGLLRRLAPNLRAVGVQVEFLKSHHPRKVRLTSVPIVPGAPRPADRQDPRRDVPGDARDNGGDPRRDANGSVGTQGDGRDANPPPFSAEGEDDEETEWSR